MLTKLCEAQDQPEKAAEVFAAKNEELRKSAENGKPPDDVKSVANNIRVAANRILGWPRIGNTTDAFLRDTLAPLITPGMSVYDELKRDIFDE